MKYYLAVDIGASSGRHILGHIEDGRLMLEEIHRFSNGAALKDGKLCWDVDMLWDNILIGMKKCTELKKIPHSIGIDTWGVDYVLLDEEGKRASEAIAYRDKRTEGMREKTPITAFFERAGIAPHSFNTIYQLMAENKEDLKGKRMILFPCYLHQQLCGKAVNEYTICSTTGLLNARTGDWDEEILRFLAIDKEFFSLPIVQPGTFVGDLLPEIASKVGYSCRVIMTPSHDTASAYEAVPIAQGESSAMLSSGTWSLLGTILKEPVTTEEALNAGFTNEGGCRGTIRFLKNIMGLWMLQCIRHELNDKYSFAEMARMAMESDYEGTVDASADRFLAPESMMEEVKQSLCENGFKAPESINDLLHAVNRSLALCYAEAIRDMSRITGITYDSIHIVGGGCNNRTLDQYTADLSGLPVYAGPTEGTAIGNLLVQMRAAGEEFETNTLLRSSFEIAAYMPAKA